MKSYFRKKGDKIENAIRKYNTNKDFVKEKTDWIFWSTQGMLRLSCFAMKKLFEPAIDGICGIIDRVVNNQHVKSKKKLIKLNIRHFKDFKIHSCKLRSRLFVFSRWFCRINFSARGYSSQIFQ
jgi:hypothetical protein